MNMFDTIHRYNILLFKLKLIVIKTPPSTLQLLLDKDISHL